jgi:hypothetical protein
VAVLAVVTMMACPLGAGGGPLLRTEIPADRYPVDAVRFVREHPESVAGELFNDMTWGGYLVLRLPEHRVFFDGRVDFYGPEIVRAYNQIDDLEPGWPAALDRHRIGWTLLRRAHRLNAALARRPDWRLVYTDAVASLYGRVIP